MLATVAAVMLPAYADAAGVFLTTQVHPPVDQKADNPPCNFGTEIFKLCGSLNFDDDSTGLLKEVSAMPLTNSAQSLKLTVLQYNMRLGDNISIPFALLSAAVTNSSQVGNSNQLKLLDPEQGKLNLNWTYAGRYHIGEFCKFNNPQTDHATCSVGFDFGVRWLTVDTGNSTATTSTNETTPPTGTSSKDLAGAYIRYSNAFIFPIYTLQNSQAGELALKLSAVYYKQSGGGSTNNLFPDAVDASGNPIAVKTSYGGYSATLHFNIIGKAAVQVDYFKAISNAAVGNKTVFSASYSF